MREAAMLAAVAGVSHVGEPVVAPLSGASFGAKRMWMGGRGETRSEMESGRGSDSR